MKKQDIGTIIKRPIVTERSTALREGFNKLVLEVYPKATKSDIKAAVELAFNVGVVSVNTMKLPTKTKRTRTAKGVFAGKKAHWKKAIVTLKAGDKVELFEGV